MQGKRCNTARERTWPREKLQPWRIGLLALLFAVHAGVVISLARPVPEPRPRTTFTALDRIELVWIAPEPAPPPTVRRPQRAVDRESLGAARDRAPPQSPSAADARPPDVGPDRASIEAAGSASARDIAVPGAFTRPGATGLPERNRARSQLPGSGDAIVAGIDVREPPSIEDRVLRVSAIFGGRRPETCDQVRQRLLGAGPGLAREMDVERLARLCTD